MAKAMRSRVDFLARKETRFMHAFEAGPDSTEELERKAADLGRRTGLSRPPNPETARRWVCWWLAHVCATEEPCPIAVPEARFAQLSRIMVRLPS